MTLELTDPAAVLAAIDEYDRIGEVAFLDKYGFGPSRGHWVDHRGKRYASKAIAGVAFGYQHGTPLRSRDFSGGKQTVKPCLEALGFSMVVDTVGLRT